MNPLDPRCHTALGRTLCKLLHAEVPPALERTETNECLRPPRGPHNALECRILGGGTFLLAAFIAAHLLPMLPLLWRLPLALLAAPVLLQIITLTAILVTRHLPPRHRATAISHFLLAALSAGALVLLASPWTRWPAALWLILCLLNFTCVVGERISPPENT
jgi:hypothetical protein